MEKGRSHPDKWSKCRDWSVPLTGGSGKFETDFSVVVLRLPLSRLLHLSLFSAQSIGLHPEGIERLGYWTGQWTQRLPSLGQISTFPPVTSSAPPWRRRRPACRDKRRVSQV